METSLLNYFIFGEELQNSCDFNPNVIKDSRGIYEVFRVINGTPLFLNEHIDRFYSSADIGGYTIRFSKKNLLHMLQRLIESNQLKNGNIQFQLFENRNFREQFIAWITPAIYPTANDYAEGVSISTFHAIRPRPQLKSTNLPARQAANKCISENNIFEVLLFDDFNLVTEGSRSNIFFIKEKQLFTSNIDKVLPGITRSKVINLAIEDRIDLHATQISIDELQTFDAAFLTSTSMNVLPIQHIDNFNYKRNRDLTNRIKDLYEKHILEDLEKFEWPY